jgi:hypothetical protein
MAFILRGPIFSKHLIFSFPKNPSARLKTPSSSEFTFAALPCRLLLSYQLKKIWEVMKKLLYILFLHIISNANLVAQTVIKGKITDRKGESLIGASITIKGSYDGGTADTLGNFSFSTRKKDSVTIVASFIGYDNFEKRILLQPIDNQLTIQLREAFNELNAVVITAGTFEASDNKRMVMLRPMDIITTASGGADITNALKTELYAHRCLRNGF